MSQVISRSNSEFLYQQVIQLVRDLCLQGSLLPGEKVTFAQKNGRQAQHQYSYCKTSVSIT